MQELNKVGAGSPAIDGSGRRYLKSPIAGEPAPTHSFLTFDTNHLAQAVHYFDQIALCRHYRIDVLVSRR